MWPETPGAALFLGLRERPDQLGRGVWEGVANARRLGAADPNLSTDRMGSKRPAGCRPKVSEKKATRAPKKTRILVSNVVMAFLGPRSLSD